MIQRYAAYWINGGAFEFNPRPDGEYVKYADHATEIERKDAEIAALKAEVERLSAPVSDEEWMEHAVLIWPDIAGSADRQKPLPIMERKNADQLIAARKEPK